MKREPITKLESLNQRDRKTVDERLSKVRGIFGDGAKFVSHTPDDDEDDPDWKSLLGEAKPDDSNQDWKQRVIDERFTFDDEIAEEERLENEEEPHHEEKAAHRATTLELQGCALYGLAGDIVKTVLPFTEAHPAALLTHILVSYGNVIGHNAHFRVEHTPHHLNLFAVLVGATSRSRKGTSRSTPGYIFQQIDPSWHRLRIKSGLSSGQGLIWAVRDPITDKEKVVDPGEGDKRLLVIEEEFSQALKSMPLEGNILSDTIRDAWDSGKLGTLTSGRKYQPVSAADAHVSIIGHITKEELLRHLDSTEQCNGFANRFLWVLVERSKRIPNPKGTPDSLLDPLVSKLQDAVSFGVRATEMERDGDTEQIWEPVYEKLTDDMPGMTGAITSRGAPQVMRLACVYALLDLSTTIKPCHLSAALALWDYSFQSARLIFGESLGDPVADRILNAIRGSEEGLSANDICEMFSRHKSEEIDRAIALLRQLDLIVATPFPTGGRPKTIYTAKEKQK